MGKNWDYGYVSDVEYVPGCYPYQMPSHLDAACLACNTDLPVADDEPFAYCELGCGRGETALMVAATAPRSSVWAFDFNPAHIAGARQIAREGKLTNVRFEESSFQELAEGRGPQDMPLFDYITFHGVWSWINRANRQYIVQFLAKYLKPGGIVYISYNALPGRFTADPMRKLLYMLAQDEIGATDKRGVEALRRARELVGIGAKYLPKDFLERDFNASYLSHEYLNEDWPLDYQIDVADDLAAAKLSFVGNVEVVENFKSLYLTEQQREALRKVSPQAVETITDYFINRPFRCDLFVRGRRQFSLRQALSRLGKCVLQLVVSPEDVSYKIRMSQGGAELNRRPYEAVFDALKTGPVSIDTLMKLPAVVESRSNVWEILGLLVGSGQVKVAVPEKVRADLRDIRRFNSVFVRICREQGRSTTGLACAATAQTLPIDFVEMLTYEALSQGAECNEDALITMICQDLRDRGDKLYREGKPLETDKETMDELASHMKAIVEKRIPLWKQLGAF